MIEESVRNACILMSKGSLLDAHKMALLSAVAAQVREEWPRLWYGVE